MYQDVLENAEILSKAPTFFSPKTDTGEMGLISEVGLVGLAGSDMSSVRVAVAVT